MTIFTWDLSLVLGFWSVIPQSPVLIFKANLFSLTPHWHSITHLSHISSDHFHPGIISDLEGKTLMKAFLCSYEYLMSILQTDNGSDPSWMFLLCISCTVTPPIWRQTKLRRPRSPERTCLCRPTCSSTTSALWEKVRRCSTLTSCTDGWADIGLVQCAKHIWVSEYVLYEICRYGLYIS